MKTDHGSFHQFSPREQNSFRESPSPSHRRAANSALRHWSEEQNDQEEMFVRVSSPRSLSKKQRGSPQYSNARSHTWTTKNTSRGKMMVMNDHQRQSPEQLRNIKQQWNAQRDIPSGTVRNNPFIPKGEPSPPRSPQLMHQKKQWDTSDIPRGSVSSKAFLLKSTRDDLEKPRFPSPRRGQRFQQRSFSSSGRDDTEVRMHPTSPRISAPISPTHGTTMQQTSNDIGREYDRCQSQGGNISSQFHQKNESRLNHTSQRFTGWNPSQEIPEGTVKGRVSTFFGRESAMDGNSRQVSVNAKQIMAETMDEDPWIIPSKNTAGISDRNWGHSLQASADNSEGWDNPKTDWRQRPDKKANNTIVKSELFESGRNSESREISSSLNRDMDASKRAVRDDEFFDAFGQALNPTNERDMDVLMAAKSMNGTSSSHLDDATEIDPQAFSNTFRDSGFDRHAFPDDDAFGSSFVQFNVPDGLPSQQSHGFLQDEFEDKFYDAGPTHYKTPQEVENRQGLEPDATSTARSVKFEAKKERRSIFNIFGGGRKDRDPKMSKSRFSLGSGSATLDRKTLPIRPLNGRQLSSPMKQSTDHEVESREKQSLKNRLKNPVVSEEVSCGDQYATSDQDTPILPSVESLNPQHQLRVFDSNAAEDGKRNEMEATLPMAPMTCPTEATNDVTGALDDVRKQLRDGSEDPQVNQGVIFYSTGNSKFHQPLPVVNHPSDVNIARISGVEHVEEDLSLLPATDSKDSDSDGSREFLNKIERKDHSRILRSGADRKRKTEKLRRYGEVNSRFKEQNHRGTETSKPDRSYPRTLKNSRYTKEVQDRGPHFESKNTNSSRHSKIKCNITGSKLAKRNEYEDALSTKTKRSKARNYARQRAGFVVDDVMHSNSSESVESVTLAAVGSDIRVLRSIVRRPRRQVSAVSSQTMGEFPTFVEEGVLDPMQQSGLKMLSATIIPMQAQVRRFLAMRHALTRMWALIVIQAHTRRWIAERRYKNTLQSAIAIQAVVRGHLARDDLDFKHVCAIEIQRVMRGYISTMKVYEDIYKITVIQSYVRMKQVMDKASMRTAHLVQLQSVFRGFLVRRRQEYQQICAIAIQANWRRFYHRLNFQFDLLDIIIVQSVWRKKLATRKLEGIRRSRLDNAAAVIQSKWRQILYTSIYVQDMANILIAQTAMRRYLARKRARLIRDYWVLPAQAYARGYLARKALLKHRAARKIQSIWRGFVGYADYMFNIADIVTVQKVARAWLARREANKARTIKVAATTIQSACRVVLSKAQISRIADVMDMVQRAREVSENEERAAAVLQTTVRRMQTQSAYNAFMAARKIQTFWRCRNLTNAYKYYRAAMTIQSVFRGAKARQETLILRGEILAATIIQSAWRGFVSYTDFIFTVSDIITVQRAFRGHLARKTKNGAIVYKAIQKRRKTIAAATAIQKGCRGLLDRQRYWYTLGCTMQIQSWMRGRLVVLQLRREAKARLKLQSFARRFLARQQYVQKKFIFMLIQTAEQERSKKLEALVVQEKARNGIDEKRRHNAACTIQRFFISVREEVDQLVHAVRRRKSWKKKNSNNQRGGNRGDELLENAWLDVACDSNLENDAFLAQTTGHAGPNFDLRGPNEGLSNEHSRSAGHVKSDDQKIREKNMKAAKKNFLLPSKPMPPSSSEFSKLTGSETAFYRLPPARMRMMGSKEMNDDLELEEAFMDTKIFNAKHRRLASKNSNYRM